MFMLEAVEKAHMDDIEGNEPSKWIRPQFAEDDAVLLVGSFGSPEMVRCSRDLLTSPAPIEESFTLLSYYSDGVQSILNWMLDEDNYIPPNWNIIQIGWPNNITLGMDNRSAYNIERFTFFRETKSQLKNHLQKEIGTHVIMIDSLTAVLKVLDFETSYMLIETLIREVTEHNGFTFVRADTENHDEETIDIFSELFNGVARLDKTGYWEIEKK